MADAPLLKGDRASLSPFGHDDPTERHLSWINDSNIMQFTEARYAPHTLESLAAYIEDNKNNPDALFWRILNAQGAHIGNLRLSGLSSVHKRADIAIIIGEKSHWGTGIATEALGVVSNYAFSVLKLNKLTAGAYAENERSRRLFEQAGFFLEARLKSHYLFNGKFIDGYLFGLLADDSK